MSSSQQIQRLVVMMMTVQGPQDARRDYR